MSDGMVSFLFSPSHMSNSPLSQPLMTSPAPRVNSNGCPRSRDESNLWSSSKRVPWIFQICKMPQSLGKKIKKDLTPYSVMHAKLVAVLWLGLALLGRNAFLNTDLQLSWFSFLWEGSWNNTGDSETNYDSHCTKSCGCFMKCNIMTIGF